MPSWQQIYPKTTNSHARSGQTEQVMPRTHPRSLHNCIAHKEYQSRTRIIVTGRIDRLVFENAGGFFEGQPEDYFHR